MPDSNNKAHAGQYVGRGDLTRALIELLQVPKAKRNNAWHKTECQIRTILNDILFQLSEDLPIPAYPAHEAK